MYLLVTWDAEPGYVELLVVIVVVTVNGSIVTTLLTRFGLGELAGSDGIVHGIAGVDLFPIGSAVSLPCLLPFLGTLVPTPSLSPPFGLVVSLLAFGSGH